MHLMLAWLGRAPGVVTRQDDANYLLLGEALRSFEYRDIFLVEAPVHRKYPPGYPALLAVLAVVPGEPADVAIATNVLLSTATLALAYGLFRPVFGPAVALAGLAVSAANLQVINYAGLAYSEALFAFLVLGALLVFTRARSPWGAVLAGLLAIAAALTRPVGVTLVLALALAWVIRQYASAASRPPEEARAPRTGPFGIRRPIVVGLLFAAVITVTVGAWLAFSLSDPTPHPGWSYAADFAGGSPSNGLVGRLARRVVTNLPVYVGSFLPSMLPIPTNAGTLLDNLVGLGIIVVGLGAGAWAMAKAGLVAVPIYLAGYLALLAVWPYQEIRFLVPLIPLIIPLTLGGIRRAAGRWGDRIAAGVFTTVTVLLLAFALLQAWWFVDRYGACTRGSDGLPTGACLTADQASFFGAVAWIREATPDDAVFLSAKPEPLFYYTRRRSVDLRPLVSDRTEPWPYLEARGVSWILMGGLKSVERNEFPEWLEPHCRRLAVARVFPPNTYLLRVRPDSAAAGQDACGAFADFRAAHERRRGEAQVPR